MTYAVPCERGPAQVPMTPLTESAPRIASDSNSSSSRSAMLDVKRRVMFAVARTSHDRACHASFACSKRSPGWWEPSRGGVSVSSGERTSAMLPSHASHRSYASASRFENCAIDARRFGRIVGQRQARGRPGAGAKYGPCAWIR